MSAWLSPFAPQGWRPRRGEAVEGDLHLGSPRRTVRGEYRGNNGHRVAYVTLRTPRMHADGVTTVVEIPVACTDLRPCWDAVNAV